MSINLYYTKNSLLIITMSGRFFKGVSDSESESSDAESDIVPLRIQAGAAA